MKKCLIILTPILLILLIVELKYFATAGFLFRKIEYVAPYKKENEIAAPLSDECRKILDEEFTYLGKGGQTYVFESFDKKYVIKFMRFHKYRTPFWVQVLDYLNLFSSSLKKSLIAKENRYDRVIKSYKLAYKSLSLVEYIHLNQTDFLNKKIIVKDKIGHRHIIDLDKVAFIIQKKVDSFSDTILLRIKNREIQGVYDLISSYFEFLGSITKNYIVNRDFPNLIRNSGCIDNRYIILDVGSFFLLEKDQIPYLKHQFENNVKVLRLFLEEHGKEYLSFFESCLRQEKACLGF